MRRNVLIINVAALYIRIFTLSQFSSCVLTITSFHHCFQLIAENSPDPPDAVEKHQNQNSDNDHSPDNRHLNNGGFTAVSSNTAVSPNNGEY